MTTRDDAGTSLVEVLVATLVLGLALALSGGVLLSGLARTDELGDRVQAQADARVALDMMRTELRQAYTGTTATAPVAALTTTTITFYSPDRSTPFRLRKVSYRLSGEVLERSVALSTTTTGPPWTFGVASAWRPVLRDVTGLAFTARDAAGNPTADPAAAREVTVEVRVDASPSTGLPADIFRVSADLRAVS
jgi:type II secretory pathway pseudopilin PulG